MVNSTTSPNNSVDLERLKVDGFCVVEDALTHVDVKSLIHAINAIESDETTYDRGGIYAARSILSRVPEVARLAGSESARRLVEPILGSEWRPVKATFFDKTPSANWKVPWHQDRTIAVAHWRHVWGFEHWTVKGGIQNVQPPASILEQMVAVRFALDDNDASNGPLRVLPGTHCMGKLSADRISRLRDEIDEVICSVPAGGALILRPLLLHASSSMKEGSRRRVIHIEFSGCELPGGLEWAS